MARETNRVITRLAQREAIAAGDHIATQFIPQEKSATISSNLLAEISTAAVAGFACGAVAGIVNAVLNAMLNAMPTGSHLFAQQMQAKYRNDFKIPHNQS